MSVDLQQTIQEQIRVLSEDEMREVLNFVQNLRKEKKSRQAKPISAIFEDLSSEISLEEWKELPADCAENHDHYLYGAPKKTE
jgi:thermostable 8-oxoguanine DNA glycosylase